MRTLYPIKAVRSNDVWVEKYVNRSKVVNLYIDTAENIVYDGETIVFEGEQVVDAPTKPGRIRNTRFENRPVRVNNYIGIRENIVFEGEQVVFEGENLASELIYKDVSPKIVSWKVNLSSDTSANAILDGAGDAITDGTGDEITDA